MEVTILNDSSAKEQLDRWDAVALKKGYKVRLDMGKCLVEEVKVDGKSTSSSFSCKYMRSYDEAFKIGRNHSSCTNQDEYYWFNVVELT